MKTGGNSKWSMLLMFAALAVIGAVYFRGLQQPITGLHDIQLPSRPTPPLARPDDNPTRPVEAAVSNPIDQTQAGRLQTAVTATSESPQPLEGMAVPVQESFESALRTAVGAERFSHLMPCGCGSPNLAR